jgi:catechol 2,3-dioxygenase-like lactoylglutathione lyase family enzyme
MSLEAIKPHIAINVNDLNASIEFYRRIFDLEPAKVRQGYAKFELHNPGLNFTLNQRTFGEAGALSHLGFQVSSPEDVLAMREQWHKRGLVTRDEMQTDCCYATQDKTWARDPDGNEWEVFVVLEDNLPERPQVLEQACCTPECCDVHTD